jgi:mannosyl-3-phosphoglycerate phosphatase
LRPSNTVVLCAIDDLIPLPGKALSGFPGFLESLTEYGIPCVWVTSRNRHQLDSALRTLGHGEPFIAEDGSCVYMSEDYFHLKPQHTVRLGRFIAIPVAKPQPAAAEALDFLSEQSGVTVVPLRSLSPRELIQNTSLPRNEAEFIRQRDFDELFFFAGTSEKDIQRFLRQAAHLKLLVRPHGSLWSLAVEASLTSCIRELRKLYDRAFHRPSLLVGIATAPQHRQLFPCCDRSLLFIHRPGAEAVGKPDSRQSPKSLSLFQRSSWERALEAIQTRRF